jgi:hypothetical protein
LQFPPQRLAFALHVNAHAELAHVGVPFVLGHTLLQDPQALGSEVRSRHELPQFVRGNVQEVTQLPCWQSWPDGHAWPHEPQFCAPFKSVSQPLVAFPSQSAEPDGHAEISQAPAAVQLTEDAAAPFATQGEQLAAAQPNVGSLVETQTVPLEPEPTPRS